MKRWWILLGLGLLGAASAALIPIEALVETSLPTIQLRLAMVLQPAVMVAVAVLVGEFCAGRAGLAAPLTDALVQGAGAGSVLRRQAPSAVLVGLAAAALLVAYSVWVGPYVKPSGELARFVSFDMPLATKLLYGGLTEELLTRWGLMSLVAVGLTAFFGRERGWILPTAIGVAALGFAAAHLPLLFLINAQPSAWVAAAVLLGNAVPGIAFGWLFWKQGLEAAMLAHMVAHAVSTAAIAGLISA